LAFLVVLTESRELAGREIYYPRHGKAAPPNIRPRTRQSVCAKFSQGGKKAVISVEIPGLAW
jgi:hypothetical protein